MSVFNLRKIIQLLEKANDHGVSVSFVEDELSVHVQKGKQIDKLLLDELRINKPFLIHYFKNFANKKDIANLSSIQKIDRDQVKRIPLSFAQERLWFIHQLEGSLQYHLPTVLRLKGKLNMEALVHALQNIVNRHEILRTNITEEDGSGFQHITKKDKWTLNTVDGSIYKGDSEALQSYIRQLIMEPFDLSEDSMLRAGIINIGAEEHVLVVTMHHIASDAWSKSVLVKEVVEFYTAYVEDRENNLSPLVIQYADYASWQRNYLQGDVLNKKLEYWKNKLDGLGTLQLPTDYPRPVVQSFKGNNKYFNIDKDISDQLLRFSHQHGTTLFITLLAVYKIMLYRYTGQPDICVGTSFARREQQELEGLIGFFVNTLALRDEINANDSLIELLQQVKTTTLAAYEHQDIPFEKIVETVVKERDPSRNPLFQVMLVLANTPEVSELKLGELELSREAYEQNTTKFEITFFITETANGLQGSVQYSTDLYREETIEQMVLHFSELLRSSVKFPNEKIGLLSMITDAEKNQLLIEFNNSSVSYPKDKSIVDLFEDQVKNAPQATALVFGQEHLTYDQLNDRANQLAHCLRSNGVREDALIPLCVERGLEMIVGMLGILKAGAAYVPIDTDFPQERIKFMLQDTGAKLIVSSSISSGNLEVETGVKIIETDNINIQSIKNLPTKVLPKHLAYVIYTSGSTGKPKGVMIEHRSLVDYYFGLKKCTQIDQCNSFALVSTIATDLGNTVIYSSLLSGGALHLFTKESVSNIEFLHNYFAAHEIDCLKIVPSHW
ncbi:MAG: condensation domain-containing protein, partial [Ginsengibacter sp.]